MNTQTAPALTWDLPDRLRKALRVADLSVNEMADELGLNRNTVGNYMSGRTEPKRPVLMAWAMRTGVPYEWLRDGDSEPVVTRRLRLAA